MKLSEIGAPIGANRKTKRLGKGSASGHGKTACRGHGGARKRSGRTTRPGFEGGQMPLMRRIPKRGFNSMFRKSYQIVNVGALNRFDTNAAIGPSELKEAGLIGSVKDDIKILGDGKLEKVLTIKAHKFSSSAKKMIEAAGAKMEILIPKQGSKSNGGPQKGKEPRPLGRGAPQK